MQQTLNGEMATMQQRRDDATELVTKSAYARSRGLSRSTICREVAEGKIPTRDGLINPREADQARRDNLSRNHKYREVGPKPQSPEFLAGVEATALHFVTAARQVWPRFVADLDFGVLLEDCRLAAKGLFVALMAHLAGRWAAEYVDPSTLPSIDWRPFGEEGEASSRECEALLADWASGAESEGKK
jgi:hypothetical protein